VTAVTAGPAVTGTREESALAVAERFRAMGGSAEETESVRRLLLGLPSELSFAALRRVNLPRCRRWNHGMRLHEFAWSAGDWALAMVGEAGELANQVKKLRRIECGVPSTRDPSREELLSLIADEMGDVVSYLDLLAAYLGIDLASAVAGKFNSVSEREGFPERLTAPGPLLVTVEE